MEVKQKQYSSVAFMRYAAAIVIIIAPFYLTFSIWLYQFVKHLDFIKVWPDIILVLMATSSVVVLIRHWKLTKHFLSNHLVQLMIIYVLLIMVIGAYDLLEHRVTSKAVIYGWITDLRPVAFFLLAAFAEGVSKLVHITDWSWRKIILIPAVVAICFGFLQATVLPNDALSHFGYGIHTTLPYETVDNQPNIVRIQSTLDGPNPFGAYIMIILVLTAGWIMPIVKDTKKRWLFAVFGIISLISLYKTYSRSAELGLIISLLILMSLRLKGPRLRIYLRTSAVVIAAALIGGIVALAHHNYTAQNLILHNSYKSKSPNSSDSQHMKAAKQGIKDIIRQPLGGGIGSAGPASRRNKKAPVRIAENFYLQIGQEAGVLGFLLFLSINIYIGFLLWQNRQSSLSGALLASFVGLSICNMLYHAWADQTLAFVWWGLAGVSLAPILTGRIKEKNAKTQQKTA